MNLYGNKVLLRALEVADNDLLYHLINDPDIEYMVGGWSFPVSLQEQQKWFENQKSSKTAFRCAVTVEGAMLGTVMLTDIDYKNGTAEIHIKLIKTGHGKGYGTDAVNTLVKYAFSELRLLCVYARVNSYNLKSCRLFEKCGFEKEGTLRSRFYKKGERVDVISYSILNQEEQHVSQ